jgi:hypothetical protein
MTYDYGTSIQSNIHPTDLTWDKIIAMFMDLKIIEEIFKKVMDD